MYIRGCSEAVRNRTGRTFFPMKLIPAGIFAQDLKRRGRIAGRRILPLKIHRTLVGTRLHFLAFGIGRIGYVLFFVSSETQKNEVNKELPCWSQGPESREPSRCY